MKNIRMVMGLVVTVMMMAHACSPFLIQWTHFNFQFPNPILHIIAYPYPLLLTGWLSEFRKNSLTLFACAKKNWVYQAAHDIWQPYAGIIESLVAH